MTSTAANTRANQVQAANTRANQVQVLKLKAALESLLAETLTRGFHGTARLEWAVQDGSIQHFRRRHERLER